MRIISAAVVIAFLATGVAAAAQRPQILAG